jgi:chromosome segregation ATPase
MSQMTVLMTDVKRRMLTVEEENAQLLVEIADVKRTLEHEQRSKLSLERIVEDQQSQIEELRRRLEAETKLRSELETVQARAGSLLLSHHR